MPAERGLALVGALALVQTLLLDEAAASGFTNQNKFGFISATFGLFTFRDLTRFAAAVIVCRSFLVTVFRRGVIALFAVSST